MENKPNLYIFLIDVLGSMQESFQQINNFVNEFIEQPNQEHNYIQIVLFHSEITVNELYAISDFHLALQKNHFGGEENIDFIVNYSKNIVTKNQESYEIKNVMLITDNDSNKNNVNITFTQNYENLQIHSVSINVHQTFNIWNYKKWLVGVLIFFSIPITIHICSNPEFNLTIEQKEEKNLTKEYQNTINNIVNNYNVTNNILYVNIKPEIKIKFDTDIKIKNNNNLHIKFTYKPDKLNIKIKNYGLGVWKAEESIPNYVLVETINKVMKFTKVGKYYAKTKKADLKITGETDSISIKNIQYLGEDIIESYELDSLGISPISIKNKQFLKKNAELGFLRAYNIGNFLLSKVDVFVKKVPRVNYYAKTNCCLAGGEYRTTEIELIIYDVEIL